MRKNRNDQGYFFKGRNRMPFPFSRRRFWQIVLAICLVLLLTVIAGAVAWYRGNSKLTAAIAEADRLDPGWRQQELEPKPPDPSLVVDAGFQNEYSVASHLSSLEWPHWPFPEFESDPEYLKRIREAMTASLLPENASFEMPANEKYTTAKNAVRLTRLLNEQQVHVLRSQVNLIQTQLEQARKQAELPVDLLDGSEANWVHVSAMLRTVAALKYDALLRAHDGDMAGAFRNIRTMLCISCWPGHEVWDGKATSFMMLTDEMLIALERTLGLGMANENELCQLQILLTRHEKTSPLLFWTRFWRANADKEYEDIQNGKVSFASFRKQELPKWTSQFLAPIAEICVARSYLMISNQRALVLHFMNEAVEIAKLPAEQQMQASQDLCARNPDNPASRRFMVQPTVSAFLHHFIMLRCAIAVIAAERFRLAQGRWPVSWEQMVPRYLQSVPLDPFSGKPLGLKVGNGLFVVYAPGELESRKANALPSWTEVPEDYGFRIFDPDRRRQPAQPFAMPPRPAKMPKPK